MSTQHKPRTKIPNRKGRAKPRAKPRGINLRGLPTDIFAYLKKGSKATGLSLEAYTRWLVVHAVQIRRAATIDHQTPAPETNIRHEGPLGTTTSASATDLRATGNEPARYEPTTTEPDALDALAALRLDDNGGRPEE